MFGTNVHTGNKSKIKINQIYFVYQLNFNFKIFKISFSRLFPTFQNRPNQRHYDECLPIFGTQRAIGQEAHIAIDQREQIKQIAQMHVEHGVHVVCVHSVQGGQNALRQFRELEKCSWHLIERRENGIGNYYSYIYFFKFFFVFLGYYSIVFDQPIIQKIKIKKTIQKIFYGISPITKFSFFLNF